jgi:signal transduction histidine kinase
MPVVTLRARLAEQQRLLDRAELPLWAHHGVPALALVLGVVAIVDNARARTWSTDPPDSSLPASVLIGLAVVPWVVAWLREQRQANPAPHHVLFAALVVAPLAVLNLGGGWLGIAELDSWGPQFSLMLLILVSCQTASCAPPWIVAAVQGAVLAVIAGRAVLSGQFDQWYIWLVAAVVLGFGGLAMRANALAMERLRQAQDELAGQAVAEERRRVAREVHDTVAHTLSVTMLHLTAARLAVERAPDRAAAALEEAERQGRVGMSDIRRIVGLLRTDDEVGAGVRVANAERVPALAIERALPTVGELPELIACYEAAGLSVTCTWTGVGTGAGAGHTDSTSDDGDRAGVAANGDRAHRDHGDHDHGDRGDVRAGTTAPALATTDRAVPPGVGVALFRVAQESLANAAKHGCGDADLRLCVGSDAVELTVRNGCRGDAVLRPGMGLVGMRERVVGLGGEFRAGPTASGDRSAALSGDGSGNGSRNGSADASTNGFATWEVVARIPTGPRL